jgi:hypothetical protein
MRRISKHGVDVKRVSRKKAGKRIGEMEREDL